MLRLSALLALCLSSAGAYIKGQTDAKTDVITHAVIVPVQEETSVEDDCELVIDSLRIRFGSAAIITNRTDHFVELSGGLGSLRLSGQDHLDLECQNGKIYTSLYIRQAPLPKKPKRQVIRGISGL